MLHTPEPWKAVKLKPTNAESPFPYGIISTNDDRDEMDGISAGYIGFIGDVDSSTIESSEVKANAERIVQCVNACANIPHPGHLAPLIPMIEFFIKSNERREELEASIGKDIEDEEDDEESEETTKKLDDLEALEHLIGEQVKLAKKALKLIKMGKA